MTRFLSALQFLTLIPVPLARSVALSEAVPFFPLTGALLGTLAGLVMLLFQPNLGPSISSLLALTTLLLLTGGLHEDGLADVADACRAGRSREIILRILKDSRIGTYGALALIAVFLLRWQALSRCRIHPVSGLIAALVLSRTSLVGLAGFSPSVGEGLGALFIRNLSRRLVLFTMLLGFFLATLAAQLTGLLMAASTAFLILGARWYFLRRMGGVNGDCLGATCQVVETVNLLILSWQPGAWQHHAWQLLA